jgi:hypothetical protein
MPNDPTWKAAAIAFMGGKGWQKECECGHGTPVGWKKCPIKDCYTKPLRKLHKVNHAD